MHVKITTSGSRRYVQLVESYRDEAGRVKKRTVATLGRAEQVDGSLDAVINGLLKITGREPVVEQAVVSPAAISITVGRAGCSYRDRTDHTG